MASLVFELEDKATVIELSQDKMVIGRHPDCGIQIVNGTVSGKHAQIVKDGENFYLEDLGSRNGTSLNEARVAERVQLSHNDLVKFGQAEARFEDDAAAAIPTSLGSGQMTGGLGGTPVMDDETMPASANATIDIAVDAENEATITGALENKGRFGVLDVNPEAKLKAVLDISSSLAGTVDLKSLLPKILDTLFNIFKYADRGCILLKDDKTGEMIPAAFKHRREGEDASVRLSRTIVSKVLEDKSGILSADAAADSQFQGSESISDLKIRSMMCVPLLSLAGDPMGLISIDSQNPLGQFTNDDLDILMVVAGQAALSYESTKLMQSYVAKQKQDNEMAIAQSVQRALLPEEFPTVEGYEFYASYDAAQAVGGDYYDCFDLGDGQIVLSFGDVAGKGVPGALIMSRMSSCVQSTLQHVQDIEEAICAINEHMCDSAVEGRFVTYVLCKVDTNTHEVQLSNAGHMSPVIRRADGTVEQFDVDDLVGPPIGVMEGYPYDVETKQLNPGDIVVIVTDGVDEAMNAEGEFYGAEKTIDFIKDGPAKADELGKALLADVRKHAAGHPQNDDITIMAFGRNPN